VGPPLRLSTRKGGGFYGYKIHAAVCAVTGLPLASQVETAARNESLYVAPLLDAVRARGFTPETVSMDKGYDNDRVYDECDDAAVPQSFRSAGARRSGRFASFAAPTDGARSTAAAQP
jgi:hypothetical protein